MYERIKALLHHCLNGVVAIIILLAAVSYIGMNTIIMTEVINDLRLDSYVSLETGFGIVMLIFLLGWVPWWGHRALNRR
jgi:hypothetical protein